MAILTFAAPVSGLRGKVGGNIFSANKAGPYLKAWARGSNPRSQIQTEHRATIVEFAQKWRDLSGTDQNGWNTYAALSAQDKINSLGETYSVSGFNWYIAINQNLKAAEEAERDVAPTLTTPAAPDIDTTRFNITDTSPNSFIRLEALDPDGAEVHVIKAKVYNSTARKVASQITNVLRVDDDQTVNFTYFLQGEIEDRFGTIQIGQRIFYSIATQNADGRRGPEVTANRISQS